MKYFIFLISLSISIDLSFAQNDQKIIELWPDEVPGEEKSKGDPVISERKDIISVDEVTNPVLEVFETKNPNGAAVIICPGGGYHILAIDKEGYEVARWLNKMGFIAFVLQYRVPQKQEGALMDIQRAIRIVRNRSDQWKIDPGKIGVLGFSAGGSLAARASTRFDDRTYEFVDPADQLSARPDFSVLIYAAYLDKGPERTLTPELKVTSETPAMFIFATADDKHANSSLVMSQALIDHKIPVEVHLIAKGGHGYGLRKGTKAAELWPELAEKWLNAIILE